MKHSILFILLTIFCSCKENTEMKESAVSIDSDRVDELKVVNEKDPVCDMDVKEHLSDTALINGEIWGFCSIVCKEKYVHLKK